MDLEYIVQDSDRNKTIKDILLSYFKISHRLLVTLKKENCILLNNKLTYIDYKLSVGDKITILLSYAEDNSNIVSSNIPLDIIYEDDWYLVINKPSGITVHPSILHYDDSLSNGVKYYFDSIGLKKKIRPVNRIDKDTSGLVIFAKNQYIQEALIRQMKNLEFKKEYIAIVEGHLKDKKETINAPISRKEGSIIQRCINNKDGDKSITHYEVLEEKEINNFDISILKCKLETGRTHQIRVHMSYINHPLLGDDLYGGNTNFIKRQALHSCHISFKHPITKKNVSYIAELPEDLKNIYGVSIHNKLKI